MFSDPEDLLQICVKELKARQYNLKLSTTKMKAMAFYGQNHIRCKLMIYSEIIEQIRRYHYLGYDVPYCCKLNVNVKLSKFQKTCGTIQRKLKPKTSKTTQLRVTK
jgi:hypothetical protein